MSGVLNVNDILAMRPSRQVLTVGMGSLDEKYLARVGVPMNPPHRLHRLRLLSDFQLEAVVNSLLKRCIDAFPKESDPWRFDRIIMLGKRVATAFNRNLRPLETDGTFMFLPLALDRRDPDALEKARMVVKVFIS